MGASAAWVRGESGWRSAVDGGEIPAVVHDRPGVAGELVQGGPLVRRAQVRVGDLVGEQPRVRRVPGAVRTRDHLDRDHDVSRVTERFLTGREVERNVALELPAVAGDRGHEDLDLLHRESFRPWAAGNHLTRRIQLDRVVLRVPGRERDAARDERQDLLGQRDDALAPAVRGLAPDRPLDAGAGDRAELLNVRHPISDDGADGELGRGWAEDDVSVIRHGTVHVVIPSG